MPPKRIIIDCDPGIDDAAAILFALASPELEVVAITTGYGNGPVEACTANAHRILEAAGRRDIPVYRGADRPLVREPNAGWASQVHGDDALGGVGAGPGDGGDPDSPDHPEAPGNRAAFAIAALAKAEPGRLTIATLGRLTNVAQAMSLEPALPGMLKEIVVMGGAVMVPGNVSPHASANLFEDPEAADIVYRSGVQVIQVGLDVCNQVVVDREQLEVIANAGTPAARLLTGATPVLRQSYERRGLLGPGAGVRYNDMPAIGYLADPTLFAAVPALVEIETEDEAERGRTIANWTMNWTPPEPNARVCLEVDAARLTKLFTERIAPAGGDGEAA